MPKKVFELANEIGMRPLELVEKLKNLGFSAIRNHMSALSDDDLEKITEALKATEEVTAGKKKKVVKKKTAKKKTAKKKVATKAAKKTAAETSEGDEQTAEDKDSKKKVVRKVVRRRASESEISKEEEGSAEEVLAGDIADEQEVVIAAAATDGEQAAEETTKEDGETKGLRIVRRPKKEIEADAAEKAAEKAAGKAAEEAAKKDGGDGQKLYKERMHTFTPVYIPKESEREAIQEKNRAEELSKKKAAGTAPATTTGTTATDETEDGKDSKKRLGGLATAMSKGKAVGKTRDLTASRSAEELKSYTVGQVGKGYYIPAKRKRNYMGPRGKTMVTEVKESKRLLYLHEGCLASELALKLSVKFEKLVNKCLEMNLLIKQGDYIGMALASEISALYEYRVEDKSFQEDDLIQKSEVEDVSSLPLRNPVVTVMGHVDHGKTTLLDFIRKAKVVDSEAGGITQHIGAYTVKTEKSEITFIDTPGHAAFASMRQRGADVTDIVILVVAADDGVMPQTKESIRFCQNAGVPVVVAVNKMDREGANPDRIKQELVEFNLTPEEWGGQTQFVEISALKGEGIDGLLESIIIQADVMELRADSKGGAEGVVIESRVESGRGTVATVLIHKGTLNKGDTIVIGETYGRARSIMDHSGANIASAGPSTPVQLIGLSEAPTPGDILNVSKNEREAKKIAQNRIDKRKQLESVPDQAVHSLEDFFSTQIEGETKILKLIVRTDVQGSFEAIKQSLEALGNEEVAVEVISGGVGAINDNDVLLAGSTDGYIIGFNMRPITSARRLAEEKGVEIKNYSVIYELINDIQLALEGMLDPDSVEVFIGRAEVRDTFSIPKIGLIAGSSVIDGKIQRGCNIRLLREGKIIYEGKMSSLKRFKDDVKEVQRGYECGIGLDNFNDVKVEDVFEAYVYEEKKRTLTEGAAAEA